MSTPMTEMESLDSVFAFLPRKHVWIVGAVVIAAGIYRLLRVGSRDPRMPKGPPTVPILGNFHQIPSTGLYAK